MSVSDAKRLVRRSLACAAAILAVACLFFFLKKSSPRPEAPVRAAFFHWTTDLAVGEVEKNRLNSLKTNRLYLRLFDIDLDRPGGQPVPLAILETDSAREKLVGLDLTACVFITSRVFEPGAADPGLLSKKTADLLELTGQKLPDGLPRDLLFDCDWAPASREGFFLFLKKMGERLPGHRLAATIRLHQFKFPGQTGVPPVASGLLMCYNTGELADWATENSILDTTDLKKYLRGSVGRYPLPLDAALPVFGWGAVFRGGSFFKLVNDLDSAQLVDSQRFEPLSPTRFLVKKATLLNGIYLHEGDLIRLEKPSAGAAGFAMREMRRLGLPNSERPVVGFYHLGSAAVHGLPAGFFEKILEEN